MIYLIGFLCGLLGPLKEAGYRPVSYEACVQAYRSCAGARNEADCLFMLRRDPAVALAPTRDRCDGETSEMTFTESEIYLPENPF